MKRKQFYLKFDPKSLYYRFKIKARRSNICRDVDNTTTLTKAILAEGNQSTHVFTSRDLLSRETSLGSNIWKINLSCPFVHDYTLTLYSKSSCSCLVERMIAYNILNRSHLLPDNLWGVVVLFLPATHSLPHTIIECI